MRLPDIAVSGTHSDSPSQFLSTRIKNARALKQLLSDSPELNFIRKVCCSHFACGEGSFRYVPAPTWDILGESLNVSPALSIAARVDCT